MDEVGIRKLKAKASEIVREVREQQVSYVVTHRGQPVGVLAPYEEVASEITTPAVEYDEDAWGDLYRLGEQITERWASDKTSTELLSEMRR